MTALTLGCGFYSSENNYGLRDGAGMKNTCVAKQNSHKVGNNYDNDQEHR